MDRPRSRAVSVLFWTAVLYYVTHALLTLDLPGPHFEEACGGLWGGYDTFQLMYSPYAGALRYYVMAAVFKLFGLSLETLRLLAVAFSLAVVYALWRLLRRLFGHPATEATLALLLTNPLFCIGGKTDFFGEYVVMMLCLFGGLNGLLHFAREGRLSGVFAAFLLFGIGLHTKINFLWYIFGMALFAAACRRRLWPSLKRPVVLSALAGFLIGFSPSILYNLTTGGKTLEFLADTAVNDLDDSHSNKRYVENLGTRYRQIPGFLQGHAGLGTLWGVSRLPDSLTKAMSFKPWACGGLALAPWLLPSLRKRLLSPAFAWSWLFMLIGAVVFFGLPFSPSTLSPTHLFMLLPFPQIYAGVLLHAVDRSSRGLRPFGVAVLLASAAFNVTTITLYDREMRRTRGTTVEWSNVWPDVLEALAQRKASPLYVDEKDLEPVVRFMSKGVFAPAFLRAPAPRALPGDPPDLNPRLLRGLAGTAGEPAYLLLSDIRDPAYYEDLSRITARHGVHLRRLTAFQNGEGRSVFGLYEAALSADPVTATRPK